LFSILKAISSERWKKSENPIIMSVIRHRQKPLEFTGKIKLNSLSNSDLTRSSLRCRLHSSLEFRKTACETYFFIASSVGLLVSESNVMVLISYFLLGCSY
jgi:hypothetical protein